MKYCATHQEGEGGWKKEAGEVALSAREKKKQGRGGGRDYGVGVVET